MLEMNASKCSTYAPDDATFFASVLDSLDEQISVIDTQGLIHWVNLSWRRFSEENGGHPGKTWRGTNYLHVCDTPDDPGEGDGQDALRGLKAVIEGERPDFYLEYPLPLAERIAVVHDAHPSAGVHKFEVFYRHASLHHRTKGGGTTRRSASES